MNIVMQDESIIHLKEIIHSMQVDCESRNGECEGCPFQTAEHICMIPILEANLSELEDERLLKDIEKKVNDLLSLPFPIGNYSFRYILYDEKTVGLAIFPEREWSANSLYFSGSGKIGEK